MLFTQNSSSSFVYLRITLGSYQETLLSVSWYIFLVKRRTRSPIAKCIDESCPVIFASCLGVKTLCIKIFLVSAKSLLIFSEGTVNVISIVSLIVPNHFSFVLGLKSPFSALTTNPAATKSFLMSSPAVLASSKLRDDAIPSSILIIVLMPKPKPLQGSVIGHKTFVKT